MTEADYVLAVIGHDLVGKTTVIQKSFKSWGLEEPKLLTDDHTNKQVISYHAQVNTGHPPRMKSVQILEMGLDALQLQSSDGMVLGGHEWPAVVPRVDGAMICYSALDSASLNGIAEVVRDLCGQMPAMVVALKSDPEEERDVQPFEGNSIGAPYNIGLVELSVHMPQGKHKMRMSFGWLLKAVSKARHARTDSGTFRDSASEAPGSSVDHGSSPGIESHEWHSPVTRKRLSEASKTSDSVIRRTQSQGAVRRLESDAFAAATSVQEPTSQRTYHEESEGNELLPGGPRSNASLSRRKGNTLAAMSPGGPKSAPLPTAQQLEVDELVGSTMDKQEMVDSTAVPLSIVTKPITDSAEP